MESGGDPMRLRVRVQASGELRRADGV